MAPVKVISLNGQDMGDLVFADGQPKPVGSADRKRAELLAQLIEQADPDVVGLVEAPAKQVQTEGFVREHLGDAYDVHQGEARGTLGLALLIRKSLNVSVTPRTKDESEADFPLGAFDSDNDGIKEQHSWSNRVPFEAVLDGGPVAAPTTFIVIHAKSKGAFIPGDLFAYERLSRANRMKLRAQAHSVRKRLDQLVAADGTGRVVIMGDFNDGPEFDNHAALLGGGFLEPVMGSVWDPVRVFHNPHAGFDPDDRWTIDFLDRVVNPMGRSKYGAPSEMRSWIDHILVSPEMRGSVVAGSAGIMHDRPQDDGRAPTDHHPPFVTLQL
jgi:exonuclease III